MRSFSVHHLPIWLLIGLVMIQQMALANPLKIELIANTTHIQPNQPFEVALLLKHPRGYHTYWKQPGIVGVATQMDWQLPQGWKAGPIQWPAPKIVHMFDIKAQGYHGEILLPILITPPTNLREAQITLQGRASWMCCAKECNPGTAVLSLTLPVRPEPSSPHPRWHKHFQKTHANLPQPLKGWTASATIKDQSITLFLAPDPTSTPHAKNLDEVIFFSDDGLINPNIEQTLTRHPDGSLSLKMKVSEYFKGKIPTQLSGLIQTPKKWSPDGPTHVSIQIPLRPEK